jgi:hypothetical protein
MDGWMDGQMDGDIVRIWENITPVRSACWTKKVKKV